MFVDNYFIYILSVYILITALLLTGIRVTIQIVFNYSVKKRLWIIYLLYYLISVCFFYTIAYFSDTLGLALILTLILVALIEFFYFFKKHGDFGSSKKYVLFLFITLLSSIIFIGIEIFVILFYALSG